MMSWFDEPPALLRQAVASAAIICDRIVVADGAYWFVHDKKSTSPRTQKQAIIQQAARHGLEVEFLPPQIWDGQVTKRDAVLQAALPGSDWVMVLDADWKIHGERDEIRPELEAFLADGIDQVAVNFIQPDDPTRGWDEKAANEWHIRQTNQWFKMAFIYRAHPVMHYRKNHWSLYAVAADGRKIGLFGATGTWGHEQPKTAAIQAEHLFEHRCLFRGKKQVLRNRAYIEKRDEEAARVGFET